MAAKANIWGYLKGPSGRIIELGYIRDKKIDFVHFRGSRNVPIFRTPIHTGEEINHIIVSRYLDLMKFSDVCAALDDLEYLKGNRIRFIRQKTEGKRIVTV